jgi:hypothetical protein
LQLFDILSNDLTFEVKKIQLNDIKPCKFEFYRFNDSLCTYRYERPDIIHRGTQTPIFFEDKLCVSTQTDELQVQYPIMKKSSVDQELLLSLFQVSVMKLPKLFDVFSLFVLFIIATKSRKQCCMYVVVHFRLYLNICTGGYCGTYVIPVV